MELLQFMEQTQCFGRSRLICIITSFLVSGSLVSPRQRLLPKPFSAFSAFFLILSVFYGTFKQEKQQKQAPQMPLAVSDVPPFALSHPQVPFPCQLPGPAGTQHTKETGFLQAKDVYPLPFLSVVAGEGGWLALGKPGKLPAPCPARCWPGAAARPGAAVLQRETLETFFYVLLNRNQRNVFCTYFFCNKLFH